LLGRLLPAYFPKIFGPGENEALDKGGTLNAFKELALEVGLCRKHS
jgi:5-oxoprolinase (ATP-hydrolysing)